jgi:hypothetical protein
MTTDRLRRAAFQPETDEAIIVLLTITHPDLATPLRFARNTEAVVSRGNTYIAYAFDVDLPTQDTESPPKSVLRIDNVDRSIVETLRQISGPPQITVEAVLASTPDVVEAGPFPFTLRNANYDILTVDGELAFLEVLGRKFPKGAFTPATHPGIF